MSLIEANRLVSFGLVVLIWLVQVIIYPAFAEIAPDRFARLARRVHPSGDVDRGAPDARPGRPAGVARGRPPEPRVFLAAAMVAVAWIATFALAVPAHDTLQASGLDRWSSRGSSPGIGSGPSPGPWCSSSCSLPESRSAANASPGIHGRCPTCSKSGGGLGSEVVLARPRLRARTPARSDIVDRFDHQVPERYSSTVHPPTLKEDVVRSTSATFSGSPEFDHSSRSMETVIRLRCGEVRRSQRKTPASTRSHRRRPWGSSASSRRGSREDVCGHVVGLLRRVPVRVAVGHQPRESTVEVAVDARVGVRAEDISECGVCRRPSSPRYSRSPDDVAVFLVVISGGRPPPRAPNPRSPPPDGRSNPPPLGSPGTRRPSRPGRASPRPPPWSLRSPRSPPCG